MAHVEIPVLNATAGSVAKYSVSTESLGESTRRRLLHRATVMYEARARQGTVKAKARGDVAGSRKKLWPQKHTGRARMGDRRPPHWKGGGVAFGPKPRDFGYSLPRRARQEALRSALLSKFRDEQVFLIDELHFDKPSTKAVAGYLKSLGINGTCLLVPKEHSEALHLSVRNLHGCRMAPYKDLNAYKVLRHRNLLLSEAALKSLLESMAHA